MAFTLGRVASALLALAFVVPAFAQGNRQPPPRSPEVHADGKVTFRLPAPHATKVELSGQFQKGNRPMEKGADGVWTVTVEGIEPNLYPYNFIVDGTSVADPGNQDLFPNERFKASLVDVPGDKPSLHAVRDVPHGEMTYAFYTSKKFGNRPLVIYTPPGYRAGKDNYPVFYCVSGTTDTEETFFRAGRLNFILDNLIAEKKAVPMIVVMPYGNMMMGMPAPNTVQAADMYRAFSEEMVDSIMPYVEKHYRVKNDRTQRAIAGFSRGGGQSLFTAFSNPDKFAYVGSYSAYLTPEVCDKFFPTLAGKPEETNKQWKLVWLGVGKDDFLYKQAVTFKDYLEGAKVKHKYLETEGGHTWMNARHYLAETLQLYFK